MSTPIHRTLHQCQAQDTTTGTKKCGSPGLDRPTTPSSRTLKTPAACGACVEDVLVRLAPGVERQGLNIAVGKTIAEANPAAPPSLAFEHTVASRSRVQSIWTPWVNDQGSNA